MAVICLWALPLGVRDLTFNVSHQLLAMRYWRVAKDIPLLLAEEEEEPVTASMLAQEESPSKAKRQVMMALNIAFPLAVMVTNYFFFAHLYHSAGKNVSTSFKVFYVLANDGTGFMQIVSGFFLVVGIMVIRQWFFDRQAQAVINNKVLCLHALAFGIYLFSVIIYYLAVTLQTFFPGMTGFRNYSLAFYLLCNLLS